MHQRTDIGYLYDGSFEGFLSCVFESFEKREIPADICAEDAQQISLFPMRTVPTDPEKAGRVLRSIPRRICIEAEDFVFSAFYSCMPGRESCLLSFLRMGYRIGPRVLSHLTDPAINALFQAVRHAKNEAHLLSGFIRLSEHNGMLAGVIEPKNRALYLIAPHFADRFRTNPVFIYDKTHRQALFAHEGQWRIFPLADFEPAQPDAAEMRMRALWRTFYDTVAIEGRRNETCRRTHLPLRYRGNMTEFQTNEKSSASTQENPISALPGN